MDADGSEAGSDDLSYTAHSTTTTAEELEAKMDQLTPDSVTPKSMDEKRVHHRFIQKVYGDTDTSILKRDYDLGFVPANKVVKRAKTNVAELEVLKVCTPIRDTHLAIFTIHHGLDENGDFKPGFVSFLFKYAAENNVFAKLNIDKHDVVSLANSDGVTIEEEYARSRTTAGGGASTSGKRRVYGILLWSDTPYNKQNITSIDTTL